MRQRGRNSQRHFWQRLELGDDLSAPAQARLAIGESLAGHLPDELISDAQLLVSELVTNALHHIGEHANKAVALEIQLQPDLLTISCWDKGSGFTNKDWELAINDSGRGFGLLIVDRLTSRWGAKIENDRHCVWLEIDLRAVKAGIHRGRPGSFRLDFCA